MGNQWSCDQCGRRMTKADRMYHLNCGHICCHYCGTQDGDDGVQIILGMKRERCQACQDRHVINEKTRVNNMTDQERECYLSNTMNCVK